tara:strand:- start:14179 stop:15468 length:1290 start_codon:yes stop_codon:yes gene_type:complete
MSVGLLDLSDSNLRLWHGETLVQSPGYALLSAGGYVFGQAARAAARLRPRDTNTRYWWQLGTDPLQPALGPSRHTADLAHAHLEALHREAGEPAELILAVPGSMQREQLSLLLGIVQQCPFAAVGLLHRSVALGSLFRAPRIAHLEIQLHQAVLSELVADGDLLSLERSLPLPGCGLLQLQERLVERIAGGFVRQTRFDPRRKAETEQQLYDALPGALRSLQSATETVFDIGGYRARITQQDLLDTGEHLFSAAAHTLERADEPCLLLADPLAGLLPGLEQALPGLKLLDDDAMRSALSAHQTHVMEHGEALSFVTSLPSLAGGTATARPEAHSPPQPGRNSEPTAAPTHWLIAARAQPLHPQGTRVHAHWELHRVAHGWHLRPHAGGDSVVSQPPRVNGRAYQPGQSLHCGDEIQIDSQTIRLIEVVR